MWFAASHMETDPANRAPEAQITDAEQRRKDLWLTMAERHKRIDRVSGHDIPNGHGQNLTQPIGYSFPLKPNPKPISRTKKRKKSKKKARTSGGSALMGSFSKRSSGQKFGR